MTSDASRRGALIALVFLTLIWSYNWIVMKQVLQYAGPFYFAALRAVLATLVLFAVVVLQRESPKPPPWLPVVLVGLAQTTGFQSMVQWALVDGGAGKTALLAYTMPFWVLLLAAFGYGDKPTRRQWLFVALAALGLALVLEPWHGMGTLGSSLLALASGLSWGVGVVVSKRTFAKTGISPLRLTAWQMLAGAIGLCLIAACVPERAIEWTPYFGAALAYNAVLASGLAWVMWATIVQRLPTTVAGITSLAVPLTGVLLAWAILGERPGAVEAFGIALIGAALVGISVLKK
ncbi:DMT family transporter [Tahibacter soli]|uniref:DMT family transporter n=1 Tax=Tahibacter soli TaxID=2983605 RepID=A0A9X4BHE3_9GAMM|nr:DMT family transporter [Tahibacter soli]MDC8014040.1 DMT family transporter [Tahibacter soli]